MNEMNTNGSVKQLHRTRNGRIVAGVCSGVSEYTGIDANILRLALAVASFFGGLGFGIYAVAWLLLPEEGKPTSIVQDLINKNKDGHVWHDAKAKWDTVQQGWQQKQSQSAHTGAAGTGSYEQHPYGRPSTDGPQSQGGQDTPQA
ncbi:PspC domain-containing protein [Microbispora sp. NBC_01189]|uniref:PspC domain-containing protein n=1 Tax=Microbispora sp. NBC_01189 TaxID=2903583 RepID=UPI002E0ED5DF|nr:PspC domain-containing protein [Microbispora sp. NBC_01189]